MMIDEAGMHTFKYEIDENEYIDYVNNPTNMKEKFLSRHDRGHAWEYGYGFYGMSLLEIDGKFFVECTIGSHCD